VTLSVRVCEVRLHFLRWADSEKRVGGEMTFVRRIFGLVVLVVSAIVFVVSLVGAGAAWPVRTRLHNLTNKVSGRVEEVLAIVDRGACQARNLVGDSQSRLWEFDAERAKDSPRAPNRTKMRLAALALNSQFSPSQINDIRDNIALAAQAAVVADSVLENADAWPLNAGARLDPTRMQDVSDRLNQAAIMAQELSDMLPADAPPDQPLPAEAADRQSRIAEALQAVIDAIRDFQGQVADFIAKEKAIRPRVLFWIDAGAVIAIVALLWIALSQVSLMAHAWGWLRKPVGERGA
jgi:hypothetical protein